MKQSQDQPLPLMHAIFLVQIIQQRHSTQTCASDKWTKLIQNKQTPVHMLLQFNETTMYKDLLDNATNTNQQLKGN